MIKVEKNVAVVLSAEDLKAMIRTAYLLSAMGEVIEDSGIELTGNTLKLVKELSETSSAVDKIVRLVKDGKLGCTLSEEIHFPEEGCFSWY